MITFVIMLCCCSLTSLVGAQDRTPITPYEGSWRYTVTVASDAYDRDSFAEVKERAEVLLQNREGAERSRIEAWLPNLASWEDRIDPSPQQRVRYRGELIVSGDRYYTLSESTTGPYTEGTVGSGFEAVLKDGDRVLIRRSYVGSEDEFYVDEPRGFELENWPLPSLSIEVQEWIARISEVGEPQDRDGKLYMYSGDLGELYGMKLPPWFVLCDSVVYRSSFTADGSLKDTVTIRDLQGGVVRLYERITAEGEALEYSRRTYLPFTAVLYEEESIIVDARTDERELPTIKDLAGLFPPQVVLVDSRRHNLEIHVDAFEKGEDYIDARVAGLIGEYDAAETRVVAATEPAGVEETQGMLLWIIAVAVGVLAVVIVLFVRSKANRSILLPALFGLWMTGSCTGSSEGGAEAKELRARDEVSEVSGEGFEFPTPGNVQAGTLGYMRSVAVRGVGPTMIPELVVGERLGPAKTYTFKIVNPFSGDLHLEAARVSCGCLMPTRWPEVVSGRDYVEVSIEAKGGVDRSIDHISIPWRYGQTRGTVSARIMRL